MQRVEDVKRNYARAEILRIMRTVKDYKQCDMVPVLGVSASYIAQIENGRKSVTDDFLAKYLAHFDVERQAFDKVEKKVIKILFGKEVEMLKIVLMVVEMLIQSKKQV